LLHTLLFALTISGAPGPAAPGDEAHRLALQSIREYNVEDFEAALRDAKQAYALSGLPALLFNLGQCHRALGHWKDAAFAYRGYLRERPDARNRAEVVALIDEMEAKASAQKPAPAPAAKTSNTTAAPIPTATPTPTPNPSLTPTPPTISAATPTPTAIRTETETTSRTSEPAPPAAVSEEAPARHGIAPTTWWLGGSGVAAVAVGTVLGVLASGNDGSVEGRSGGYVYHSAQAGPYATGQAEGLTADILWSVGGALVVAAIVVAVTSH
jgi:hypothetical protein